MNDLAKLCVRGQTFILGNCDLVRLFRPRRVGGTSLIAFIELIASYSNLPPDQNYPV